MSLFRIIVVLAGGLLVMLCVVMLRAESTRLHYEISQCEHKAEACRQVLREKLELARLRNPMLMRRQVERTVRDSLEAQASASPPAAPARRGKP